MAFGWVWQIPRVIGDLPGHIEDFVHPGTKTLADETGDINNWKNYWKSILDQYQLGPQAAPQISRPSFMVPEGTRADLTAGIHDKYGGPPGPLSYDNGGASRAPVPSGFVGPADPNGPGKPTPPFVDRGFTGDASPFGNGNSGGGLFPSLPASGPQVVAPPMIGKPTLSSVDPGFTGDTSPFGGPPNGGGLSPLPSGGPMVVGGPSSAGPGYRSGGSFDLKDIIRRTQLQQLIDQLNGGNMPTGGGLGLG